MKAMKFLALLESGLACIFGLVLLVIIAVFDEPVYAQETTKDIPDIREPEAIPVEAVVEEVTEPEPTIFEEQLPIEPVCYVEEMPVPSPTYIPVDVYNEPEPILNDTTDTSEYDGYSEGVLTCEGGVNYYNGRKETWYSQRVLPGGGLDIPGRHVDGDGLIRDEEGYICVAASDLEYGTLVETSLGMGKVYDTGCAPGTTDIYTDW